jgi:glycosyltransferase involved in cell wall biosynthesis
MVPSGYATAWRPVGYPFYREQFLALAKRGLRVGVVYPENRPVVGPDRMRRFSEFTPRFGNDEGLATYRITYPHIPKAPRLRAAIWLRQLQRLVDLYVAEQGKPDLLHAHGVLWGGAGAVRAGRSLGVPVVVTAHSTAFARGLVRRRDESTITEVLLGSDAVLAVSGALRARLIPYAPDVEIQVVPNLVDTEFFDTTSRAARRKFTWLSVAALRPKKGLDVLLNAFAKSFGSNPNVELRIAGRGPMMQELVEQAGRLGLAEQVEFIGLVSRERIRSEMQAADGFVLPSRVETFGVVVIEAMATGLPVVATVSGGPEEIVTPETGLIVQPDDADALGRAMAAIMKSADQWRSREALIRGVAVDCYGELAVTDKIIEVYRQVLRGRQF